MAIDFNSCYRAMMDNDYREILEACFIAGVNACRPKVCLPDYLQHFDHTGKICVLGAGKAAAQMAAVMVQAFPEQCYGTVVTRYGHADGSETGAVKVLEAAHPVPDENSLGAAKEILQQAQAVSNDDFVVFLFSGGGSALMCLPVPAISFEQKSRVHQFLLRSGAAIDEINTVRKHLSAVKGGKLAAAVGKTPFSTFIISDVVGDDPAMIASGPTVADISKPSDALAILEQYAWQPIREIEEHLQGPYTRASNETKNSKIQIIASAGKMLQAAVIMAEVCGWNAHVISVEETGEARDVAEKHAELALAAKQRGERCILFSGGELTVAHDGKGGRGGPNQEYLLALAIALNGEGGIAAIACDSDGIDGSEDNAGAFISSDTMERATRKSMVASLYLERHDSYSFFASLDDLIVTGPTHTNVNDFRAILVDP